MDLSRATPKLKVLHIASGDLWAGAEVQLFTLLSQLRDGNAIEPHAALLNDGELARKLRDKNIAITVIDETKLNGLQILWRLRKLMIDLRPNVIHTHRQKENVLGVIANLLAARIPSVRTCHGAPEHTPKGLLNFHRRIFYLFDFWCGKYFQDRIIAVSQDLKNKLTAIFPAQKVVLVENGIDVEVVRASIKPVDFRLNASNTVHVGIVGRLQQVKRVDLFLDMAALLLQQAPEINWHFHVIGDGPLRQRLTQQAATLDVTGQVTFHGHRPDSTSCLAGLDVLVMCSDHEGLPMTVLESIAVTTPVVAHAVGGLTNLLHNDAFGILVTDHLPQAYASAVVGLLHVNRFPATNIGQQSMPSRYLASSNAEAACKLYRGLAK
ncbi:MAG: hypothetical protein JWM78_3180 [Verrucomicrobiaceae bacterium]|nr:hypothetical protein [Verrucomicrobiaceae bacterium]